MNIEGNPDYESFELQNYNYTVLKPDWKILPINNQAWCEAEFAERTGGISLNPGKAWKLRREYWEQFLVDNHDFPAWPKKIFDYAYPDRLALPLANAIKLLKFDPMTRRAFIPVFDRQIDMVDNVNKRIPCTIGYWLNYRQGKLNIVYLQRSADFSEHFANDIYLADRLKCFVAEKCGMTSGTYSHWLGSLHVFAKDVKEVF